MLLRTVRAWLAKKKTSLNRENDSGVLNLFVYSWRKNSKNKLENSKKMEECDSPIFSLLRASNSKKNRKVNKVSNKVSRRVSVKKNVNKKLKTKLPNLEGPKEVDSDFGKVYPSNKLINGLKMQQKT